jgi:putative Mg2+ transporter-C (MgtC) family protein
MPELSWAEVLLRLVLAAVLGGVIGAERELRDREAGLRTHMLVSLGAALFTLVSAYAWTDWQFSNRSGVTFDPTRIAAQIVSGIGFLGAGAIIRQGVSVRGLTTAATLWAVAAIGMASGAGYYEAAALTTLIVLVSLWPLRILAHRLFQHLRPSDLGQLYLELRREASAAPVLGRLEQAGIAIEQMSFEEDEQHRRVVLDLDFPSSLRPVDVVEQLHGMEGVEVVRWRT